MTTRPNNNLRRSDRSLRAYLEIAMQAAREAQLVHLTVSREEDAIAILEPILREHTAKLKTAWLQQPKGGIAGWRAFVREMGYRETLRVEPLTGI